MENLVVSASARDIDSICELLNTNGLPIDGVAALLPYLWTIAEDGETVGCVGLEVHDTVALFRSLAVSEKMRGRGLGGILAAHAEKVAAEQGVLELFLLTDTAEDYFARRGYDVIDRKSAPQVIQSTREFAVLCGSSATAMRKGILRLE